MAKISINNISNAIYESLKDKKGSDLDLAILNTIQLLKDKHLLSKKEEILERLEKIIDKEEGVVRAKIHTRDKLGSKEEKYLEEYIKHKYKAKQVYLEKIENKEILGGIKVEIGNEITDLSLSKKLHQLQNYLITN
jgi:F-type H+-transporting ATPase subunit delta